MNHSSSLFFRMTSDGQRIPVHLEESLLSPEMTSCWLIGGGPSLNQETANLIQSTPAHRMTMNLAGTGLLRPTLWTAYDPTERFHRSLYSDASILKFLHRRRATNVIPETTWKVSDCPNLVFFEGDRTRGFHNFLSLNHLQIVDWNDTFVQSIDLLYRLGFRTIYLAGCEMQIHPSPEQIEAAARVGVTYHSAQRLGAFVSECEKKGLPQEQLAKLQTPKQYHFDEEKPLKAAIATDDHYFRIVQYLRLCRVAMTRAGMSLISVTPNSRLNDHFPTKSPEQAAENILHQTGNPAAETTRGRYTKHGSREATCDMRDFRPPNWKSSAPIPQPVKAASRCSSSPKSTMSKPVHDVADITLDSTSSKASLLREIQQKMESPIRVQETG